MGFDFIRNEPRPGKFFGEQQRNNSRSRPRFERPVAWFYAAEVGKKEAVEREAAPFFWLRNLYDTGAAERNGVAARFIHRSFSDTSRGIRLGLFAGPTQTAIALHSVISFPVVFSFIACRKVSVAPVISETQVSTRSVSP